MFRCNLGKHVQKIGLHGEMQSILVFNHLKQAGQREYDKPDSGVNGQIKLMQQDSRVMCVNGPVRAERVWWLMGEFTDGDPTSDESHPLLLVLTRSLSNIHAETCTLSTYFKEQIDIVLTEFVLGQVYGGNHCCTSQGTTPKIMNYAVTLIWAFHGTGSG
jgi:hypothetical protein